MEQLLESNLVQTRKLDELLQQASTLLRDVKQAQSVAKSCNNGVPQLRVPRIVKAMHECLDVASELPRLVMQHSTPGDVQALQAQRVPLNTLLRYAVWFIEVNMPILKRWKVRTIKACDEDYVNQVNEWHKLKITGPEQRELNLHLAVVELRTFLNLSAAL